jgi:hypothetical protein
MRLVTTMDPKRMMTTVGLHLVHGKVGSGKTWRLRQIAKDTLADHAECWVYSMPLSSARNYEELQVHATWRDLRAMLLTAQGRMHQALSMTQTTPLVLVLDSLDNWVPSIRRLHQAETEAALTDLAEHCAAANIRVVAAAQTLSRFPDNAVKHAVTMYDTSIGRSADGSDQDEASA